MLNSRFINKTRAFVEQHALSYFVKYLNRRYGPDPKSPLSKLAKLDDNDDTDDNADNDDK